jgi:transposase
MSPSTRVRCYPSDMTDADWAVIEPLLPVPGWLAGRGGSPGTYGRRDIVDAIRYLVHNGCVWRALPGRSTDPTAAVIDSQSVKVADTVGKASRGYDAGKKIAGRKRHIAVDATGLLLCVTITAASVQDRDAAKTLLWNLAAGFRQVSLIWADGSERVGGLVDAGVAGDGQETVQALPPATPMRALRSGSGRFRGWRPGAAAAGR